MGRKPDGSVFRDDQSLCFDCSCSLGVHLVPNGGLLGPLLHLFLPRCCHCGHSLGFCDRYVSFVLCVHLSKKLTVLCSGSSSVISVTTLSHRRFPSRSDGCPTCASCGLPRVLRPLPPSVVSFVAEATVCTFHLSLRTLESNDMLQSVGPLRRSPRLVSSIG